MAVQRLLDFLKQNHTDFSTMKHEVAYTALSSAKSAHIPSQKMVKSVLLLLDNVYTLAVLPSSANIDFKRIKEVTGAHHAKLAEEEELETVFPDCATGSMPPLGNLYHIPVISDKAVTEHEEIFFEDGSHREIMKMHIDDFIRLTHPKVATIHRD